MKIKAKIKAFYNGTIVKPGEVVEFEGDKLPTWATLAESDKQPAKKEEKKEDKKGDKKEDKTPAGDDKKDAKKDDKQPAKKEENVDPDANNADKLGQLEALQTEGIELSVAIDTEGKTIQQQIDELTEKIAEAKANK
jgi:hypothetical protein